MSHIIKIIKRYPIDEDDHYEVSYDTAHQLKHPIKTFYQSTKIQFTQNRHVLIILDISTIYNKILPERNYVVQAFQKELQFIVDQLDKLELELELEPGVIHVTNMKPLSWHWLLYYDTHGNVYKCIGDKSSVSLRSL